MNNANLKAQRVGRKRSARGPLRFTSETAFLAALTFAVCVLSTGCAEFLDSAVQSPLDQSEINQNTHHYENHGQAEKTARENANFDFLQQHDRFPQ